MSRSILSRLGAGLVAAALVAGGSLLVAAPASAAGDVVTPGSVVENSWGHDGKVTVSGQGNPGDALTIDIVDGGAIGTVTKSYLSPSAVTETVVQPDGTYTITFDVARTPTSDFRAFPLLGETPFAAVINNTADIDPIFLPIGVTAFARADQNVVIDPICLSGDAVRESGVSVFATGFDQYEDGSYVVTDAAGGVVQIDDTTFTADETGSVGPAPLTLYSTAGNIPDGVYTITFSSASVVGTAGLITIGNCETPTIPSDIVDPTPQLANTGSSDAGILAGGSALLLLVGAALMVARRRQNAAA
ncbi:LPXTG cell wall anchor domain-containing protein [Agreia pratensis]|uniref:LPXTG-motif cell wall anchor domain-containing protein n=1 Tax=Agreia pratensis TaxID=150121 RepID=A0A1X7JIR0_9MICO|nr:LPXTG cell wall anchor domain-containing protein [Agreia pratensis]SMG27985.1 LPXTG-motif cell wall anchor domain-containing protein [Agreia pratensis]